MKRLLFFYLPAALLQRSEGQKTGSCAKHKPAEPPPCPSDVKFCKKPCFIKFDTK